MGRHAAESAAFPLVLCAAVALAAPVLPGQTYHSKSAAAATKEFLAKELSTAAVPAPARCPGQHVELFDGSCERCWRPDAEIFGGRTRSMAVKPVNGHVRKLCSLAPEGLKRLQDFLALVPAEAWRAPDGIVVEHGQALNYTEVAFHFPKRLSSPHYLIYPQANEVHSWIEPILLNITARYNYKTLDEGFQQAPGYLRRNIPRLILGRLGPGTRQRRHRHLSVSSQLPHRIHVPLVDVGGNTVFNVNDPIGSTTTVPYRLDVGYAYEVNNLYPHWLDNQGNETSVQLLFEFLPVDVASSETDAVAPPTNVEVSEYRTRKIMAMPKKRQKKRVERAKKNLAMTKARMSRDRGDLNEL